MAFEKIRNKKVSTKGKCALCRKVEKAGTINVIIKDLETKTVASRTTGCCESCGVKAYEAAVEAAGFNS